ncbi:hypothetical protein CBR_g8087 [Chara braunii]|uniref:Protein kinase domain-containing protein n=1 Tax=Chara braunii TaxID=69332 RepID=A0A388KLB6_CHABU|nr:hypothetical protein CBR_g8087 [Chara braunii]|eukprot:GBG70788.1 hypothetical protein CBR_g8087 [Chara braunii]
MADFASRIITRLIFALLLSSSSLQRLAEWSPVDRPLINITNANLLTLRAQYAMKFIRTNNYSTANEMPDPVIVHVVLSPKDRSLFIALTNGIWRMSTYQANKPEANAALLAAGSAPEGSFSYFHAMALQDSDSELTGAVLAGNDDTQRTRILHVASRFGLLGGSTLRALSIDANESLTHQLYARDYPSVTATWDSSISSMAIDSSRRILYVSTGVGIHRVNLTYPSGGYSSLQSWIGVDYEDPFSNHYRESDDPEEVRLASAKLGASTIGEAIYFVDQKRHLLGRIRASTGAVHRIAGGTAGRRDGPASEASFSAPQTLAVTHDGCNVFILETQEDWDDPPARLLLITLNASWGKAANVATVASILHGRRMSLDISPESDTLYVGAITDILELGINTSALPRCAAPSEVQRDSMTAQPSSSPSAAASEQQRDSTTARHPSPSASVRAIAMASAGVLLLVVAYSVSLSVVVIRRRRGIFTHRRKRTPPEASITASSEDVKGSGTKWTDNSVSNEASSGMRTAKMGQSPLILRPNSGLKRYSLEETSRARVLSDGQVVAVNMMKDADFLEAARFRQFQAELDVLGSLRHSQICGIVGYWGEEGKSFLVYPFVEGGTLHDRLRLAGYASREQGVVPTMDSISDGSSCTRQKSPLDWKDRLSIARQIASALRYLHEQVDPPVVHRDVKSKNVLLEDQGEGDWTSIRAYLSDSGLAKVGQSVFGAQQAGETVETYHVAGTFGYMAPEYYSSCRLTAKNDVHAFGVLRLEVITGRQAFMNAPRQEERRMEEGEEQPEVATEGNERETNSTEESEESEEVLELAPELWRTGLSEGSRQDK